MYNTNGRMLSVLLFVALMLALVMTAATPDLAVAGGDPKDTIVVGGGSGGGSPAFNPYASATSDGGESVSETVSIDVATTTVFICLKTLLTWGFILY